MVRPGNFKFIQEDGDAILEFELPSGSYATIVLGQMYTLVENEHGG